MAILANRSSTKSLQSTGKRGFPNKDRRTDIQKVMDSATYRLNRPRDRFTTFCGKHKNPPAAQKNMSLSEHKTQFNILEILYLKFMQNITTNSCNFFSAVIIRTIFYQKNVHSTSFPNLGGFLQASHTEKRLEDSIVSSLMIENGKNSNSQVSIEQTISKCQKKN